MPKDKKQKPISREELNQRAVQAGLKALVSQPGLRNYAVLMSNNLDDKKIYSFINEIEKELKTKNVPYEKHDELIYKSLASYVASGNALKDKVRQTIFEKGYEGKLDQGVLEKIVGFFKPKKFEGEKYFEKARNAYGDMYDILSQDKVAQEEIPELTKAAKAMKMYGFLDVALKSFKAHGMMEDKIYKTLSQELYKKTVIKSEKGMKGLENYILSEEMERAKEENPAYQKVAALIIGFVGIMSIISNLKITGAVVGTNSPPTIGIVGALMIFLALFLFFRGSKKKL